MERMIQIEDVDSTGDCVEALNREVKRSSWKRRSKFNIKDPGGDSTHVRVFSDGVDTISIIQTIDGAFIVDFNLDTIRPLIEKIQAGAKKIYTFDYGEIFLNPWDMKVWIVGGDSGIIKSDLPRTTIARMMEEGSEFQDDLSNIDLEIEEIKETIVEAEYFPPMCKEDEYEGHRMEWILVGRCNDLGDLY